MSLRRASGPLALLALALAAAAEEPTQNAGAFDAGSIANCGTSTVITMSAAGSFAYHCNFQPTMMGTLKVTQ